jgi:hypothetical protein
MFREETLDKREFKQTREIIYMDMLQYYSEHPGTNYTGIFGHFVDQAICTDVQIRIRTHFVIWLMFLSALIGITVCLSLTPMGDYFLHYIPTSYCKIQH